MSQIKNNPGQSEGGVGEGRPQCSEGRHSLGERGHVLTYLGDHGHWKEDNGSGRDEVPNKMCSKVVQPHHLSVHDNNFGAGAEGETEREREREAGLSANVRSNRWNPRLTS